MEGTTVCRRMTTVGRRRLTVGRTTHVPVLMGRGLTIGRTTPVPVLMGWTRGDSGACNSSKGGCDKRE